MSKTIVKEEMVKKSNQPQKSKKERKHIDEYEYFITMERYSNGELTDEEIKELEEDIKSWELFRITSLVGLGLRDIDGVPTPILKKELRDINRWDFNGGKDGKQHISCFNIQQFTEDEDEKKLHRSVTDEYGDTYKSVGEYYRTLRHQLMVYQIHYKMDLENKKR